MRVTRSNFARCLAAILLAALAMFSSSSGAAVATASAKNSPAARTYFDNGKLKTLTNKDAAGAMVEQHTLGYIDSGKYLNGNRVSDVFQLKGPDASAPCYAATCTASWTYDARERLTQEVNGTGTTTTFVVDVIGNVTTETPSGGNSITRTYNGQQLATQTSAGVTTKFLHDSLGNQDCAVKSSYSGSTCPGSGADLLEDWIYDYKSRLAGYRSFDGNGNPVNTVSYTNDPLDRPVKQVSNESGSTTTYNFTYLGITDQVASETLTGATNTTKRYAFDAFGRRATITDGANRYGYLHDPHGSVSLVLDQAGTVKGSYGYNAYGTSNSALTKAAVGFSLATNPYRYTSKRLDTASNTLDMGARRYARATGRFLQYDYYDRALDNLGLSVDPLTGNRYALAGGNPISYVEVDGHAVALADGDGKGTTINPCIIFKDCSGRVEEGDPYLEAIVLGGGGIVKGVATGAAKGALKGVAKGAAALFGKESAAGITRPINEQGLSRSARLFGPVARKMLQKLTAKANEQIGADPALAASLLSAGERRAAKAIGSRVIAASYGKAVERRVGELITDSRALSRLFEVVPQRPGVASVDLVGRGAFSGLRFDITTQAGLASKSTKALRFPDVYKNLYVATYTRPTGLTF